MGYGRLKDSFEGTGMRPEIPGPPADHPQGGSSDVFRPHGRTTVWAEGAVVHVLAEGPFNREAVDAFSRQMIALYAELPPGLRFVNLTEFRHSMAATPESWDHLETHLQRVDASGVPLVATAWIAGPQVEGRALFMPRGRALFARQGRCFEGFETMAEAEDWARDQLARAQA